MSWNTAHTAIISIAAISVTALMMGKDIPYEVIIGGLSAWAVVRQAIKSKTDK